MTKGTRLAFVDSLSFFLLFSSFRLSRCFHHCPRQGSKIGLSWALSCAAGLTL